MKEQYKLIEEKMEKSVASLKAEFDKVRAGRANPAVLDGIKVDYYGTATPIPFQDWSHPLVNEMTNSISPLRLEIKCFGKYTFKISNPALFMCEMSGTSDMYTKTELVEQIKAEMIGILQNLINELGNSVHKIPVLELPSQTDEIKEIIDERECDQPIRKRGLSLVSFIIESVTLTDESEEKIDNYEYSTNSYLQKGRMVDAYSNAIENAASNSHGVLNGMMGVGIVNMTSDGMLKDVANKAFGHTSENSDNNKDDKWECSNCKKVVSGAFCCHCGAKRIEERHCKHCGEKAEENASFCSKCGNKI